MHLTTILAVSARLYKVCWPAREKICYAIYCSVKQFDDLFDKTDHKNLMLPFLGRYCGGNFTFKIKTSISCMFLEKKYINMCLMRCLVNATRSS